MGRKTIQIERVREIANQMLANSNDDFGACPQYREAIQRLTEALLHETENYNGFRYLEEREVPEGQTFGIRFGQGDEPHEFFDVTRVHYF